MLSGLWIRSQNWPLTIASAALGLGVVGALIAFANMADVSAREREQSLLQNGVAGHLDELARRPTGNAVWDEAVANLDVAFDMAWAQANVGEFLSGIHDLEFAAVLDRTDSAVYAMRDGEHVEARAITGVFAPAAPLVEKVRAAEQRRGPVGDLIKKLNGTPPETIYATEIVNIDGRLVALTATLVQPDFGQSLPAEDRSAIIITGDVIDQAFVAVLAERYLLTDARLEAPNTNALPGRASITLRDAAGQPAAQVQWQPARPGANMLMFSMPLTLMALTSLALLACHFQKKGRIATEQLITSEARASHLAYHDAKTGLPNRLMLSDDLDRARLELRRDGRPFALHCIDLDRFKEVHDSVGEAAADDLIDEVARLFAGVCGPDDKLARLGMDEFAILQSNATPESATALAAQLIELMAGPVEIPAGRMFPGCSIGFTLVEDETLVPSECLRQADLALNRAKATRRGHFLKFEPDMDAALRTRLEIREELRTALADGQLRLAYQPQVHQGGKMYGVEALIRWNHPTRGEVSPALFIPIAEESGLIEPLGLFVLQRAFEDSKLLGELRVAINLSAAQFRLKDFIPNLAKLVEDTGVDVERIELEITEGLLLADDPSTHDTLAKLRGLGFRIALDDFGTGYSSLSYLQRYPIDKIKIDRSFITNLGTEPNADAIVNAIVRLARALRLDVIAEGVETEIQRVLLAAAGCDDIQGYLFGRPMPLDRIEQLLLAVPASQTQTAPALPLRLAQ